MCVISKAMYPVCVGFEKKKKKKKQQKYIQFIKFIS